MCYIQVLEYSTKNSRFVEYSLPTSSTFCHCQCSCSQKGMIPEVRFLRINSKICPIDHESQSGSVIFSSYRNCLDFQGYTNILLYSIFPPDCVSIKFLVWHHQKRLEKQWQSVYFLFPLSKRKVGYKRLFGACRLRSWICWKLDIYKVLFCLVSQKKGHFNNLREKEDIL